MSKELDLVRLLINGANEYEKETGNKNPTVYLSRNNLLVIEKALLKAQKSLKALDIIKEKYVHIPQLLCAFENQLEEENPLEVYYNGQVGINVPMPLTEEEFNLLKEVLE